MVINYTVTFQPFSASTASTALGIGITLSAKDSPTVNATNNFSVNIGALVNGEALATTVSSVCGIIKKISYTLFYNQTKLPPFLPFDPPVGPGINTEWLTYLNFNRWFVVPGSISRSVAVVSFIKAFLTILSTNSVVVTSSASVASIVKIINKIMVDMVFNQATVNKTVITALGLVEIAVSATTATINKALSLNLITTCVNLTSWLRGHAITSLMPLVTNGSAAGINLNIGLSLTNICYSVNKIVKNLILTSYLKVTSTAVATVLKTWLTTLLAVSLSISKNSFIKNLSQKLIVASLTISSIKKNTGTALTTVTSNVVAFVKKIGIIRAVTNVSASSFGLAVPKTLAVISQAKSYITLVKSLSRNLLAVSYSLGFMTTVAKIKGVTYALVKTVMLTAQAPNIASITQGSSLLLVATVTTLSTMLRQWGTFFYTPIWSFANPQVNVPINLVAGDNLNIYFNVQDINGNPFDLTGCVIDFTVKRFATDTDGSALISKSGVFINGPQDGLFAVYLTPTDTANLNVKWKTLFIWDVRAEDAFSTIETLFSGTFSVSPATRKLI